MRAPHSPETVERCRRLVETTLLPSEDIAAQTDTSEATVRRWTRRFGWKRPDGAPGRLRIPPDKYPAVRRIYACGARSADIALLARCSVAQFNVIAAREGWTRDDPAGDAPPAAPALSEALAGVEAALRQPDLARPEFMRLLDRAMALTAAEALAGAPGVERTAQTLTRLASAAKSMPGEAPPAPSRLIHPGEPEGFPDANELIEEIARRFEQDANAYLDPRILAILAETVP